MLWVRRRWPVQLALAVLPLSLVSAPSGMVVLILLFTVVVHRPLKVAGPVVGLHFVAALVYCWMRPDPTMSLGVSIALTLAFTVSVVLAGMVVRARRQLVVSFRDRAHRAEAEQQLRVAQARHLERTRIAREMHDVLAHRISLLSLHAGALEFRPDAPPEEVARAAGVIRDNAHQALQDLREVIGVLREDTAGEGPERPQPTLADLATLAEESRDAGMRVRVQDLVIAPDTVPAGIGRSAYRIVQEGLTNARKHALGAAVTVTVAGGPGAGLSVEVSNPWPVGRPPAPRIPGTGTGLVGLAERTSLAGGRLEHGRTEAGDFRLAAWLPWSACCGEYCFRWSRSAPGAGPPPWQRSTPSSQGLRGAVRLPRCHRPACSTGGGRGDPGRLARRSPGHGEHGGHRDRAGDLGVGQRRRLALHPGRGPTLEGGPISAGLLGLDPVGALLAARPRPRPLTVTS